MELKTTFICGIHNIEVKQDLGDGLILTANERNSEFPQIRLTNNKAKIKALIEDPFSLFIGIIEYQHILEGYPLIAFSESKFDVDKMTPIEYLDLHHYLLKMYFFCLWLTKDNAADFDIGFLKFKNRDGEFEVSSNMMSSSNFNVNGMRESCEMSLENLGTAIGYLKNNIFILHKSKPKITSASSLSRISIANHFVQGALATSDLGLKAVGYCSALETLFANGDNAELSHKLSERVSKYLAHELTERIEIYKSVKKIYEIRSRVVHGATFKPQKTKELAYFVKEADDICRRVMLSALTVNDRPNIFEFNTEKLREYFLELALK